MSGAELNFISLPKHSYRPF